MYVSSALCAFMLVECEIKKRNETKRKRIKED
jgi:hypothetical protein